MRWKYVDRHGNRLFVPPKNTPWVQYYASRSPEYECYYLLWHPSFVEHRESKEPIENTVVIDRNQQLQLRSPPTVSRVTHLPHFPRFSVSLSSASLYVLQDRETLKDYHFRIVSSSLHHSFPQYRHMIGYVVLEKREKKKKKKEKKQKSQLGPN
jgi:hypothetical protein